MPKKHHQKETELEPKTPKGIEYLPPSAPEIERYVGEVCGHLEAIDGQLNTPEVRRELSNFMKVIAALCAKIYTRHGKLLDTNPE